MQEFLSLNIAVITLSDTRTADNDLSGDLICQALANVGHHLSLRRIVRETQTNITTCFHELLADSQLQVIISTGGTGFANTDLTYGQLMPMIEHEIIGFGELFRSLSYAEIGSSTIQSRAFAGIIGQKILFALPGSTNACRLAIEKIILPQIDSNHKPCNLVDIVLARDSDNQNLQS